MNYKAGDTVVCIDTLDLLGAPTPWKNFEIACGAQYVVHSVGGGCTALAGRTPNAGWDFCENCGFKTQHWHYSSRRFIKLDPLIKTQEQREEATA